MKIIETDIPGVAVVETTPFRDHRGEFMRCFCEKELAPLLGARHIVQINRSMTPTPGCVRGLHFQYPPHAEMKLVRCTRGRVFDVAVDIRMHSPTFLRWFGCELSPQNARMLAIPEGFAHGFQVLEAESELFYLTTAPYSKTDEAGITPEDPAIGIRWPLPVVGLSERDRDHPRIDAKFQGVVLSAAGGD
jgi:dTDP-4-dehydrorhamnose 3,5-epimerase